MTSSPWSFRNRTLSRIIARFSSSVVPSAWVTWKSHDLPKIDATPAPDGHNGLQVGVVVRRDARPPGAAEGAQRRMVKRPAARRLEKLHVFRVGARPAAFDVVDAELIEPVGDAQFVVGGKGNAFPLRSVAKRRVEQLDAAWPWAVDSLLRCGETPDAVLLFKGLDFVLRAAA